MSKKLKNIYPPVFGLRKRQRFIKSKTVPVSEWSWTPFRPELASLEASTLPRWNFALETNYRPSKKRQKVVLVFEQGVFTDVLLDALTRRKIKYFCLDYTKLYAQCAIDVSLKSGGAHKMLRLQGYELNFDDVFAVLWCTPGDASFTIPEDHLSLNDFVNVERWRMFLRDLPGLLPPQTIWLPSTPLNGSNEWQNRFSELNIASDLGLMIPETLCTDNPSVARQFIERHGPNIMFREVIPVNRFVDYGVRLGNINLSRIERVKNAPSVFQQYIEKEYEIRSVVLGSQVFSVKIDSQNAQSSARSKISWKVYDNKNVRWEKYRLPKEVEKKLIRLTQRLGINWGSADLIKSVDGNYYFLEINRPGAQYWLNPFAGINTADKVASYLEKKMRLKGRCNP